MSSKLAAAAVLALLLLLCLGSAQAETVTFTARNDRGVVLSNVDIARDERPEVPVVEDSYEWDWVQTDLLTGKATLTGISSGETVWVERRVSSGSTLRPGSVSIAGGFAEAYPVTISPPVTSEMDLIVPSLPLEPYKPELSDCERSVVGLINDERRRLGRQPVYLTATLTAAADAYLVHVQDNSAIVQDFHRVVGTPTARARDMGFPPAPFTAEGGSGVGENLTWEAWSPEAVFQRWMNSPPHREAMLNPDINVVGMGHRDRAWALEMSGVQDPALRDKAGVTDDIGDTNAGSGPTMSCLSDRLDGTDDRRRKTIRPVLRFERIAKGSKTARVGLRAGEVLVGRAARIVVVRKRLTCRGGAKGGQRSCRWEPRARRVDRRELRRFQILRIGGSLDGGERLFLRASTRGFRTIDFRVTGARAGTVIGPRPALAP